MPGSFNHDLAQVFNVFKAQAPQSYPELTLPAESPVRVMDHSAGD